VNDSDKINALLINAINMNSEVMALATIVVTSPDRFEPKSIQSKLRKINEKYIKSSDEVIAHE
jgi:hypothetical protein